MKIKLYGGPHDGADYELEDIAGLGIPEKIGLPIQINSNKPLPKTYAIYWYKIDPIIAVGTYVEKTITTRV